MIGLNTSNLLHTYSWTIDFHNFIFLPSEVGRVTQGKGVLSQASGDIYFSHNKKHIFSTLHVYTKVEGTHILKFKNNKTM